MPCALNNALGYQKMKVMRDLNINGTSNGMLNGPIILTKFRHAAHVRITFVLR